MRYITYTVGGRKYASELLSIREVVLKQAIRPVPGGPEWLLGVMALRGELVPVVDLGLRLKESKGQGSKVLILDAEKPVGFLVDDIKTIEQVEELKPIPLDLPEEVRRYLTGSFLVGEEIALVLELGKVLREEELSEVETN